MNAKPHPLPPELLVGRIQENLEPLASAARAAGMAAYMRGQFAFLGIAAPARRGATMDLLRGQGAAAQAELMMTAQGLWRLPEREYQYVAADLLIINAKSLEMKSIPRLWRLRGKSRGGIRSIR